MKKHPGAIFLLCMLGLCSSVGAQTPAPPVEAAKSPAPAAPGSAQGGALTQALNKAAGRLAAGGVVAAEVEGDAVRFFTAGKPAPHDGIPPEKVIFEIGSITKVFTSLLLAQAVVEHKVALDDPISRYLPPSLVLDPTTAGITLEQLATHTSGLPRMADNFRPGNPLNPYADYTADNLYEFLRAYHAKVPPPRPPDYSNLGVALLGHLLERVYQQPYADLIAAKITQPLGLADTVINLNEEQQGRAALPHDGAMTVEPWRQQIMAGAGALHSTAADLVRFAQIMMDPEKNPLRAAWEIARQPRHDFMGEKIGLNIMLFERDHRVVYNHDGGTGGFRSYLEWSAQPAPHVLVLLENNTAAEPAAIVASLYAPKPANQTAYADRAETPLPADKVADYPGVYAINERARFTIVTDDTGRLQARLTGQTFGPIFNAGNDLFFARIAAAEFQFRRSPDGHVDSVVLLQNGRELKAQRTDEPLPTVLFLPVQKLKDYVGHYEEPAGSEFEVIIRARFLAVKLGGQQFLPVFPDQPDHFVYEVVKAGLTFERGDDGTVTALVLHQNGQELRAEKQKPEPPKSTPSVAPAGGPQDTSKTGK